MRTSHKLNYYEILGVPPNSSTGQIKQAYLKLAKKYHPDSPSGNERMFKQVAEAYEVLSNPEYRQKHDSNQSGSQSTTKTTEKTQTRGTYSTAKNHKAYKNFRANNWSGGNFSKTQDKKYKEDEEIGPLEVIIQMIMFGLLGGCLISGIYTFYILYKHLGRRTEEKPLKEPVDIQVRRPERKKAKEETEQEVLSNRNRFNE